MSEKIVISNSEANVLSRHIVDALYQESANILPMVCKGYGLMDGTVGEAFQSKRNYVDARIRHLSPQEIFDLANKMNGKYPGSELEEFLSKMSDNDQVYLTSQFEGIRETLIKEIGEARYLIWVAVAWFTDNKLANALYSRSKSGVNIQIVMSDDEINNKLKNKLEDYFEVCKVPPTQEYQNLMHHKFCVIDLETVIHGSYNWTVKAQYNDETISVVKNRAIALEFADEFIALKMKADSA